MGFTGLFLCLFLVIHLVGNLQLLADADGKMFNLYAYKMTHNPLIKAVSYFTYFCILLHAVKGLLIWWGNKKSKGKSYKVKSSKNASWASKNMALLGTVLLAYLIFHMGDFWYKMKFGSLPMATYEGQEVLDLFVRVKEAFSQWWIVLIYTLGMIPIALHLLHGFQSAFKTFGINHPRYTPIIKGLGTAYSILIPLGFAIIPLYFYFFISNN